MDTEELLIQENINLSHADHSRRGFSVSSLFAQVLAQQPEDVLSAFAGRIHERIAELGASEVVETQVRTACVVVRTPLSANPTGSSGSARSIFMLDTNTSSK